MRAGRIATVAVAAVGMAGGTTALVPDADAKRSLESSPFVVADSAERSLDPKLVAGSNGRTVAFWYDLGTDSIARRAIAADGSLGPEGHVVTQSDEQVGSWWVVPARAGSALVLWRDFAMPNAALRGRWVYSDGRLGPIREVAPAGAFGGLSLSAVADARGDVTIAWSEMGFEAVGPKNRRVSGAAVYLRRWAADDRLGPRTGVARGDGLLALGPHLAVAPSGRIALAWWEGRTDPGSFVARVAHVDGAGRAGPSQSVTSPQRMSFESEEENELEVTVDRRGEVTVVWHASLPSGTRLLARRTRMGARPGPQLDLGAVTAENERRAVTDRAGRTTVVWVPGTDLPARRPVPVLARAIDAAGRLGATRRLTAPRAVAAKPVVAVDRSGRVTAVWGVRGGGSSALAWSLQSRAVGARGRLGALRSLTPRPGRVSYWNVDLVVDGGGRATAAWTRYGPAATIVMAARLPAASGGQYGAR